MNIEVDEDYFNHPKTLKLKVILKLETADVYPLRLWGWATKYAKDGKFASSGELEEACGWPGPPGRLALALVSCGFASRSGRPCVYVVHNWMKRQGQKLKMYDLKKLKQRQNYYKSQGMILEDNAAESGILREDSGRIPISSRYGGGGGGVGYGMVGGGGNPPPPPITPLRGSSSSSSSSSKKTLPPATAPAIDPDLEMILSAQAKKAAAKYREVCPAGVASIGNATGHIMKTLRFGRVDFNELMDTLSAGGFPPDEDVLKILDSIRQNGKTLKQKAVDERFKRAKDQRGKK